MEGMAAAAALLLVTASMAAPIFADSSSAGSSAGASPWLSFSGQAWMNYTGSTPILTETFTSQSSSLMNATAFATLHNSIGQTVAISTVAIVALNPGQNATVRFYLPVPLDAYTVDIFALSSAGTLISPVTNSTVVA